MERGNESKPEQERKGRAHASLQGREKGETEAAKEDRACSRPGERGAQVLSPVWVTWGCFVSPHPGSQQPLQWQRQREGPESQLHRVELWATETFGAFASSPGK